MFDCVRVKLILFRVYNANGKLKNVYIIVYNGGEFYNRTV